MGMFEWVSMILAIASLLLQAIDTFRPTRKKN